MCRRLGRRHYVSSLSSNRGTIFPAATPSLQATPPAHADTTVSFAGCTPGDGVVYTIIPPSGPRNAWSFPVKQTGTTESLSVSQRDKDERHRSPKYLAGASAIRAASSRHMSLRAFSYMPPNISQATPSRGVRLFMIPAYRLEYPKVCSSTSVDLRSREDMRSELHPREI
ncbi:hypothetical protein BC826DRAFT_150555 [Russula brevipes]|nr:hypothetical protein BC826DRAFT_150555 [Russula brevipes]